MKYNTIKENAARLSQIDDEINNLDISRKVVCSLNDVLEESQEDVLVSIDNKIKDLHLEMKELVVEMNLIVGIRIATPIKEGTKNLSRKNDVSLNNSTRENTENSGDSSDIPPKKIRVKISTPKYFDLNSAPLRPDLRPNNHDIVILQFDMDTHEHLNTFNTLEKAATCISLLTDNDNIDSIRREISRTSKYGGSSNKFIWRFMPRSEYEKN